MTSDALTETEVASIVEFTEAAAYADLLRAAPAAWQCVAEQTAAGWFLLAPPLDFLLFNRVIGCGLSAPARQSDVAALVNRYRTAALRNYGVQLSPLARPTDLTHWLREAGLVVRDNWTKVYRAAKAPAAVTTDLRVEAIGLEHATTYATITCAAYGMPAALQPWIASIVGRPQWHHYLAWDGLEPVAAAALFVLGEVGWLGIAGTLPAERRRGAQGALMARRLLDGITQGCRWFVTETGQDLPERPNPSFHNMLRMGFTVAYQRPNVMPSQV